MLLGFFNIETINLLFFVDLPVRNARESALQALWFEGAKYLVHGTEGCGVIA